MSDIFREVEEEVRRERLEKIWKDYGDYIIAGVAVIVIAVAGFEFWQRYEANKEAEASAEYNAALQLADQDPAAAIKKFEDLSQHAPSGYATLAKFLEADILVITGDHDKALSIYQSLGASDEGLISNAARLRAAWSIADFAPRATIEKLVGPLNTKDSAWRFLGSEVLAYADFRTGALDRAEREYSALANDSAAPNTVRERARSMASLIKSGGEKDFGTVPPPATPLPGTQPPKP